MGAGGRSSGNTVAVTLVCLLSAIVLLSASASPPLVEMSDILNAEDGAVIRIVGVVVDIRLFDSGAESLILADLQGRDQIKVIASPGIRPQPSVYAHVGDEVQVEGEVSSSGYSPVIFSVSDDIILLRESDRVLTVKAVSDNWLLFEGDVIRLRGILRTANQGAELRFHDCTERCSIAISSNDLGLERFAGATMTLTATLYFDRWMSRLALTPAHAVAA